MSAPTRSVAAVVAASGIAISIGAVAPATAVPQCTNTAPMTTQCERPGNAQINTAPSGTENNYPWGWPWWGGAGITISLGRGHGR